MRRLSLASLPLLLILAACGGPDPAADPELHTVPAANLRLTGAPAPDTRRLTVEYTAGALLWKPKPVDRVEVDQDAERVVVRVFLTERVPAPGEAVPNYGIVQTVAVALDRPLGRAAVLDGSVTPPAPMPGSGK